MAKTIDISVIIPALNEEQNVELLYNKLKSTLSGMKRSFEVIFVDDGSTDNTFKKLEKLNRKDKRCRAIKFKRNFGKSAALFAGLTQSTGKYIVTIDADMQIDPNEIPKFVKKLEDENYDILIGWRHQRKDSLSKKFFSKIFNMLVRLMTRIKIHDSDCDLKVFRREMIQDLNLYGGLFRYIPSIAYNKGYKTGEIKVGHNPRKYGKPKFNNYSRLFTGFMDLITIKFLISYRYTPLYVFGFIGIFLSGLGFLTGLYYVYLWAAKQWILSDIGSRPLLMLAVFLVLLGVQFISMGLLGEMITHNNPRKDIYSIEKVL